MTAVTLVSGRVAGLEQLSELLGPWLLTTLGVGLLGAVVRASRTTPGSATDASYESARRLLSQLRTVARRLSSGLDSVTLASDLLRTVQQHLDDTHAAVFTRTDGGVLAPLGYRGPGARDVLQPDGSLVERCWHEMEPLQETQAAGAANRRHRIVLPLRVGSRLIGVVVSEAGAPADAEQSQRADARGGRARPPPGRRADLRRDPVAGDDPGTAPARTRDPRRRRPGDRLSRVRRRRPRREQPPRTASGASSTNCAASCPASSASCGCRSSTCAPRCPPGSGPRSPTTSARSGARSGMTVHTTLDVAPTRLRGEVETELFRIAQEAITNARKHSAAKNLWVDCRIRPPLGVDHGPRRRPRSRQGA